MSPGSPAGLSAMTDTSTTSTVQTFTVGEGDDLITYDVRGDKASGAPLFMFACPMEASAFSTLASHFPDRPVVTYDPRGAGRNPTGTTKLTPEAHAADLHRVVDALGAGPVDVFASSGGAVNALAWAAAHPEDVRRVVAHEPPTAAYLPDRDAVLAAIDQIVTTYRDSGNGPAMARFIALVMRDGELPADYVDGPAPDPATFGMSGEDDGERTNPLIRNMPATNVFEVDVDALRALGDRVVVAVGAASHDEIAARGARSVAEQLSLPVTELPSHHAGFLGDEHGQQGEPEAFGARLREVLA